MCHLCKVLESEYIMFAKSQSLCVHVCLLSTLLNLHNVLLITSNLAKTPLLYVMIMPPTSKKLEGHIASGTFVRACVRPLRFSMHSITSEPCTLGF